MYFGFITRIANQHHFSAASQLVASISSYQYTRRAWRRDVFDLFFEPCFFQLLPEALVSWMQIIDNLMTQDKNTFREALSKEHCLVGNFSFLSSRRLATDKHRKSMFLGLGTNLSMLLSVSEFSFGEASVILLIAIGNL
ncbi:unnamed protein product [Protopolystoma xenopodis]|uniref:DOP1-like C-terminal domain-containing protein n=1 Tax=Protopolystoma xenopodis TaxID=117903 RepID=A0A3S4ZU83_9PLAT|nr:unnamed protein product [Protopolystoma xenopodis]